MHRAESRFDSQSFIDIDARLRPARLNVDRYTVEGGDRSLAASALVSLAEEILSIEREDPSFVSDDLLEEAMNRLINAAEFYDECGRLLEGWRQRAKVLASLRNPLHNELACRLIDQTDDLKMAMDQFGQNILTYPGTVNKMPRYQAYEREVRDTNRALGVGGQGNGNGTIGHGPSRPGV